MSNFDHPMFAFNENRQTEERAAMDPRPLGVEYDREMTPGEIGCAASFQRVLRRVADGVDPFVCVLEDDADALLELCEQQSGIARPTLQNREAIARVLGMPIEQLFD